MKTLKDVGFGYKKDPVDTRDFSAKKLIFAELPLPTSYRVNPNTIIYNQNGYPACVGFASAGVKTDQEFFQHKLQYPFDGMWLYNECKKIDGIPGEGGTYPRVALGILQKQGIKQVRTFCKSAKPDSYWQIKGYYRIEPDSSIDLIKQIVYQYGSLLVGSVWYESWMNVREYFNYPKNEKPSGGHAYRVSGWNKLGFIVVNSWGRQLWGIDGVATILYDIFNQIVLPTGDAWKVIDN